MKFANGLMYTSFGFAFLGIITLGPHWFIASLMCWCIAWCFCLFSQMVANEYRAHREYEENWKRLLRANEDSKARWGEDI